MIDYWCNAFTPDRAPLWHRVIAEDGLSIRLGARGDDDFCPPEEMVARMDRLGIDTLVVPVGDLAPDRPLDDFAHYTARRSEIERWHAGYPTRYVGMWSVDPTTGDRGVEDAAAALDTDWCVALHSHTHSWDRCFDDPDYLPFYAVCADRAVPFVMQAGMSGGHRVHESGHPDHISAPAAEFPDVTFVLSHTGAPWVAETIRVATAHPNVVIGTATHPPRRWPAELLGFLRGPGAGSVLYGSGYPLTGHGHALDQLRGLELTPPQREALVRGTARRVFARLPDRAGG